MAMALLSLLVFGALLGSVSGLFDYGTENTYINNLSSRPITATTSYFFPYAHSDFIDREIAPNTNQHDEYSGLDCDFGPDTLQVELWVSNSCCHNHVNIYCDESIVAFDNADKSGVDIYLAVYDHINEISGSLLVTIYP